MRGLLSLIGSIFSLNAFRTPRVGDNVTYRGTVGRVRGTGASSQFPGRLVLFVTTGQFDTSYHIGWPANKCRVTGRSIPSNISPTARLRHGAKVCRGDRRNPTGIIRGFGKRQVGSGKHKKFEVIVHVEVADRNRKEMRTWKRREVKLV